ncbi:MAG: hypothetical protein ACYTGN_13430 [Planctomycetota bacterium]|jgi:hypothetical protein
MPDAAIRSALKNQYHAALAMLGQAIRSCPDELWEDTTHTNAAWQLAYHTLFFAHMYMQPSEAAFAPWAGHRADCQVPDCIPGPPDPNSDLPLLPPPYTREQALEYWRLCVDMVDPVIDGQDVLAADSGFSWYPISKLEHHMVNLRHIQHGAAQLADRLRANADIGVDWRGSGG